MKCRDGLPTITATPREHSCAWRPSHDVEEPQRAQWLRALRASRAAEKQREEEAAEWFARWHAATGQGETWADVDAENAVLARLLQRGFPARTSVAELRRVAALLSGERRALLRAVAAGDAVIDGGSWDACPAMPWAEAVARLEEAAALRGCAHAASIAFEAARAGDRFAAVHALFAALGALGESVGSVDEACAEALSRAELSCEDLLAAWDRIRPEAIALAAEVRALRKERAA